MRVWNSLDEVPTDLPRTVVTLGNFDGVHRGHREVLRRVVELARALASGGKPWQPAQDHGFMYGTSFTDPDGNVGEAVWMDPAAIAG